MGDARTASYKSSKRGRKKKMKQCWTGEENLPLLFQAKHFLKALSNKEPALWHATLQRVSGLGRAPRQRTTLWMPPHLPLHERFPQSLLNILTFSGHFGEGRGTRPGQCWVLLFSVTPSRKLFDDGMPVPVSPWGGTAAAVAARWWRWRHDGGRFARQLPVRWSWAGPGRSRLVPDGQRDLAIVLQNLLLWYFRVSQMHTAPLSKHFCQEKIAAMGWETYSGASMVNRAYVLLRDYGHIVTGTPLRGCGDPHQAGTAWRNCVWGMTHTLSCPTTARKWLSGKPSAISLMDVPSWQCRWPHPCHTACHLPAQRVFRQKRVCNLKCQLFPSTAGGRWSKGRERDHREDPQYFKYCGVSCSWSTTAVISVTKAKFEVC